MTDHPSAPAARDPSTVTASDGTPLAYHYSPPKPGLALPTVVFLGGFRSDMTGSKALSLEAFCQARGQAFLRLDYSGHGASGGAFEDGTIGRWCADALTVIDHATTGPLILVGSSMGGWIMLLAALARPARVAGLLGIAAAPDFTQRFIDKEISEAQRSTLEQTGRLELQSAYDPEPTVITRALIADGRDHLLLHAPIAFAGPVRLIHGQADADVPWQVSLELAAALTSTDVEVQLVKAGDHRLSAPDDLLRLRMTLAALSDRCTDPA